MNNGTTKDLVVTRVFDAPVQRVWLAWTDAEQVMRWWGPNGFTAPVAKMDIREGGTSLVCMRTPDGHDLYNTWTYREIVPMRRLEFIMDFADKDGTKIDPTTIGLPPELARGVRHVLTFATVGDSQAELTVTEYGYTSDQVLDMSKSGLEECLDKMAASFADAK